MFRVLCTTLGDPELLSVVEERDPRPEPGHVVVAVEAAGVSFVDGLIVQGRYQVTPALPFTPGGPVAGRVVAVGEGVDPGRVGTRVVGTAARTGGGYTTHAVLPGPMAVPVPEHVPASIAASAFEGYLTLVFAVTHRVTIEKDEWVVVLGAGGGIGLAAVDVARGLGARVLGVASSADKRAAALAAGAEAAIDYTDLKDGIRAATGGGADVVIDPVGGPAAESALRALGTGGRYCVVGFASGDIPRLPANIVLLRNRSIVGVDFGDWSREVAGPAGNAALLADVVGRIGRGELHPPPPTEVPLTEAAAALRRYADRTAVGKYVLVPSAPEE